MRMRVPQVEGRSRDQPDLADRRRAAAGHLLHAVVHLRPGRAAEDRAARRRASCRHQAEDRSDRGHGAQAGSYRVNDRELVNNEHRHAARRLRRGGGRQPRHGGDDARRRARHAPVGGHRPGCAEQARLHPHQVRHHRRLRSPRNEGLPRSRRSAPRAAYRRLLSLRPSALGMWLIGLSAWCCSRPSTPRWRSSSRSSWSSRTSRAIRDVLVYRAGRDPLLFLVRGVGDYMSNYFPGYVGRQVIKAIRARPVPPLPASAGQVLRQGARRRDAVEAHVQRRAGGRGGRPSPSPP